MGALHVAKHNLLFIFVLLALIEFVQWFARRHVQPLDLLELALQCVPTVKKSGRYVHETHDGPLEHGISTTNSTASESVFALDDGSNEENEYIITADHESTTTEVPNSDHEEE